MKTLRLRRLGQACGHLALYNGLYMAGAVAALAHAAGLARVAGPDGIDWEALACAACAASGVYLFDRVKLTDRLLDPADERAHPERYRFLGRNRPAARALSVTFGLVAIALAWRLHPAAAMLIPSAYLGVWVYAGRRGAGASGPFPRPKDIFLVKNAAVSVSIVALAAALAVLAQLRGEPLSDPTELPLAPLTWSGLFVLGHVFVDSTLCDLDDTESDRRFGTQTLPNRLGPRRTWAIALAINGGLLAVAAVAPAESAGLRMTRLLWGVAMLGTLLLLLPLAAGRVRDLVDLRLPLVATLLTLLVFNQ